MGSGRPSFNYSQKQRGHLLEGRQTETRSRQLVSPSSIAGQLALNDAMTGARGLNVEATTPIITDIGVSANVVLATDSIMASGSGSGIRRWCYRWRGCQSTGGPLSEQFPHSMVPESLEILPRRRQQLSAVKRPAAAVRLSILTRRAREIPVSPRLLSAGLFCTDGWDAQLGALGVGRTVSGIFGLSPPRFVRLRAARIAAHA